MPKCQFCNNEILWKKTRFGKMIPVEIASFNVLPSDEEEIIILNDYGEIVKGKIVGDANEQGYYVGHELHYLKDSYCKR